MIVDHLDALGVHARGVTFGGEARVGYYLIRGFSQVRIAVTSGYLGG